MKSSHQSTFVSIINAYVLLNKGMGNLIISFGFQGPQFPGNHPCLELIDLNTCLILK